MALIDLEKGQQQTLLEDTDREAQAALAESAVMSLPQQVTHLVES